MAETAPLYFEKALGVLRAVNADAQAALNALPNGERVRVRITAAKGNSRRMAMYWATLGEAAPFVSELLGGDAIDAAQLHMILKDRRGLYRPIRLRDGSVIKDYESVSFSTMTEPERAAYFDWALATLDKWLSRHGIQLRAA